MGIYLGKPYMVILYFFGKIIALLSPIFHLSVGTKAPPLLKSNKNIKNMGI
jgi:hypothetical protein